MASLEGEWLERNKHRAYPFVENADLTLQSPYAAEDATGFYLDAYLVYRADAADNERDHHWRFVSVDPSSNWNAQFYNTATGSITLLTPISNTVVDGYRMLTYADEDIGLAFTLVVDNNHALATGVSVLFSPPYPPLVSRCLERQIARVEAIGIIAGVWVDLGEIGELLEGTNIKIEVNPDIPLTATRELQRSALRPDVQRIMISAIPGAGTGKVEADCSQPVDDVFMINNIPGNNGEFNFDGDDCYRVERRFDGGSTASYAIQLDNNCQPCCDCDDFVAVLEGIRRLAEEGLAVKDIWSEVRSAYVAVKNEWELRVQCVGDGCISQLFGYAFTGWLITVQIWVGNMKDCIQSGVSVDVGFNAELSTEYVPGSGMIYNSEDNYFQSDPIDNGDGTYSMLDNSAIRGGHYKLLTFAVRVLATAERSVGMTVDIAADVTACGEESVELLDNVVLIGNTNKA